MLSSFAFPSVKKAFELTISVHQPVAAEMNMCFSDAINPSFASGWPVSTEQVDEQCNKYILVLLASIVRNNYSQS